MFCTMQNCMTEFSLHGSGSHADPFNDVQVDAVFTGPDGAERIVPAFWAGGDVWRVRYASLLIGRHTYRTVCSDVSDAGLHGREGAVEVTPYEGSNPLFQHGPLRVNESGRYLEHVDGTPFFYLADTWWMALCRRLAWPWGVRLLTEDRVAKGFSIIQIIAGLYPDMPPFDERGANEAGFPWEEGYARINPAYFDQADLRMGWLVDAGLLPCVVGCWGYFMEFAGPEVLKKHWRYLVARWGAWPVVWCVAGETIMPWYRRQFASPEERQAFMERTRTEWVEVARYLRSIDPFGHPMTTHPTVHPKLTASREIIGEELADIQMLQTGHGDTDAIPSTVAQLTEAVAQRPRMPVLNSEVCYEGIGGANREHLQRFMFWACMLSGAAGHAYGANGIWQVNTHERPYGPSPHGMKWGDVPWQEAYRLPGSEHLGVGKRLLERYE